MCIRSLTWVYCHLPVRCTAYAYHVHQEATLGVNCIFLSMSMQQTCMCIRSLTWCTVYASRCTAYAVMYTRRHTTALPTKSTTAVMCIRSLTWCTVFACRCTACDWGSKSWPPDHDSTFHVTEMPALTTWPPVTSTWLANAIWIGKAVKAFQVAKEKFPLVD